MNKRWFIGLWLALALVSGCRKPDGTVLPDDGTPVPIVVDFNSLDLVQTRSRGPLEGWNGEDIYLYAVERRERAAGEAENALFLFQQQDPLMSKFQPLKVQAPTESGTSNVQVTKSSGEHFYYKPNTQLDFYAYSVDDAVLGSPALSADGSLRVTLSISGRQDILMAKADPKEDCADKLSPEEAYGPLSARRDIHPHLRFRHKLSRFVFRLQSNDPDKKKFTLERLSVYSKTQAQMLVVHPRHEVTAPEVFSPLDGSEGWLSLTGQNLPKVDDPASTADVLVMPGASEYAVEMLVRQDNAVEPYEMSIIVDLSQYIHKENGAYTAEPGYQYKILLTLNGREKVDVQVTLEEWKDGGSAAIDPDAD